MLAIEMAVTGTTRSGWQAGHKMKLMKIPSHLLEKSSAKIMHISMTQPSDEILKQIKSKYQRRNIKSMTTQDT